MADESKPTGNTKSEAVKESTDTVKARLLARGWLMPVLDSSGKVVGHRQYWAGQVIEIPRPVYDELNQFKATFEEVTD